jgi:aminoglycoside phosphotransferase (APT) family kinase protein
VSDRLTVTAAQVAALILEQFPHWAHLPVRPVASSGWDNYTFHLGDTMKVRLPSADGYVGQVEKENTVLPRLAPLLPLRIPSPVAVGKPGAGYPFPWSIYDWIDGDILAPAAIADLPGFASDLAGFLNALHHADASFGPPPGDHNFHRGGDLRVYDEQTRSSIAKLGDRIDGALALAVWEQALASRWEAAPIWVHGDIAVGNLLLRDGRLSAIIDFGTCAVGDPACDLVISWLFLDEPARRAFRATLPFDAGTWARARGWALWKALLVAADGGVTHPIERRPLWVAQLVMTEARVEGV